MWTGKIYHPKRGFAERHGPSAPIERKVRYTIEDPYELGEDQLALLLQEHGISIEPPAPSLWDVAIAGCRLRFFGSQVRARLGATAAFAASAVDSSRRRSSTMAVSTEEPGFPWISKMLSKRGDCRSCRQSLQIHLRSSAPVGWSLRREDNRGG